MVVLCWETKVGMNVYEADTRQQLQIITNNVIDYLQYNYDINLTKGITKEEIDDTFHGDLCEELFDLINNFAELNLGQIRDHLTVIGSYEIDNESEMCKIFDFATLQRQSLPVRPLFFI